MLAWMAMHPFISLIGWFALGIIGWGWANYCAYKDDPASDSNPKKRNVLFIFMLLGLMYFLVVLLVMLSDRKFYFGLRFK